MTIKEKIEKEIAQLSQQELMKLHEIIVLLHKDRKLPNEVLNAPPLILR